MPTSKVVIASLIILALQACSGRGGSSGVESSELDNTALGANRGYPATPLSCEVVDMRRWIQANMQDYYLFYDQLPDVDLNNYSDLEALVRDLRVQPFDRFSYLSDAAASSALFNEGMFFGFGWKLVRTGDSNVQIGFVYPQSPLAEFGVERGDHLLAINGVDPLQMTSEQWNTFLGRDDEVVTPVFTLQDSNGQQRDISVTKAEFKLDTVLQHSVIDTPSARVGYLAFTAFLETSNAELDTAFQEFGNAGITELILDLRYNGGGRISVANNLASKIVGAAYEDRVFADIAFNDKYADNNQSYRFNSQSDALNLARVFVLTTSSTCSASEMVINGLRPFVDVVTVGSTTCGKPYGSAPDEACGKAMNALRIKFVNASGEGDYYEGLPGTCAASDDVQRALGDSREAMLATALGYLDSGSCQQQATASRSRSLPVMRSADPLLDESNLH